MDRLHHLPLTRETPPFKHKHLYSWEPVHYLAFGSGLQTWEYSPEYTLRSYAYLLPHAALAKAMALALGLLQVRLAFPGRMSIQICHPPLSTYLPTYFPNLP